MLVTRILRPFLFLSRFVLNFRCGWVKIVGFHLAPSFRGTELSYAGVKKAKVDLAEIITDSASIY
jgi:hypothetical protein